MDGNAPRQWPENASRQFSVGDQIGGVVANPTRRSGGRAASRVSVASRRALSRRPSSRSAGPRAQCPHGDGVIGGPEGGIFLLVGVFFSDRKILAHLRVSSATRKIVAIRRADSDVSRAEWNLAQDQPTQSMLGDPIDMNRLHPFRTTLLTASLSLFLGCSGEDTDIFVNGTGGTSNQGTGGTTIVGTGGTSNPGVGGTANSGTGGSQNPGAGGTVDSGAGGVTATGGITGAGSTASTGGGASETGGAPGTGGVDDGTDQNGKTDAAAGESSNQNQDYLKLGEIRILNNNWGSEDLGCSGSMFEVFVDNDSSFGWNFNRPTCGGEGSKPDFPQVEFGVHPFGVFEGQGMHHLATSPNFSSTPLMPIQIQDIQSASVTVSNLSINLQSSSSWNITFEFWVSKENPLTAPDPVVYAELMTFWGWQPGRWPDAPGEDGSTEGGCCAGEQVNSAGKDYTLWVQRDQWADGWRYFQFRDNAGPQQSFNGTVDVKPFLDYLMTKGGFAATDWVTRLEVGSEIDDNTSGTVRMADITFEVNGESRSAVIAP